MSVHYESRYALGPVETKGLDTTGLRENFLIETVFADDEIRLVYTHYDRYIAGGAKPVSKPVKLETIDALKAPDRKSVVSGKSVSVRVDLGGRRIIKKTKTQHKNTRTTTQYENKKSEV